MAQQDRQSKKKREGQVVKFLATTGTRSRRRALSVAGQLGLDRLPDVSGELRLLLSPENARQLLERGFEVQLLAAIPVAPLDKSLIMSDARARAWLEKQLKGTARGGE